MSPNAWENADPFCGSGDSATIDLLEAAVNGKLNLSEITEEQFRADLRARFLAHYTAQLARVRAYIPLVVELQQINTRE